MPILNRDDADEVPRLSSFRKIMPCMMRKRSESLVYYEQRLDLTRTLPFIEAWNAHHDERLTLFDWIVVACAETLHSKPGLNRFVSGSTIYQRRNVDISFAVKQRFDEQAPLVTVKARMPSADSLRQHVHRLRSLVEQSRAPRERPLDKEMRWLMRGPRPLVRGLLAIAGKLDSWNALPAAFTENDPMFASMFLANLGSVGLDSAFHHLYEYGTISLFGAIGKIEKVQVYDASGEPQVRDVVEVRWTFDERINDGFYCAAALERLRALVEDPTELRHQRLPVAQRPRVTEQVPGRRQHAIGE